MGIVINQSIKNTVITYLGFAIGAINTLFLYTYFLEKEQYGLVSYILTTSNLLWPLMAFGVHNTMVKFFTSYQDKAQQKAFLSVQLVLPAIMGLLIGILGYYFYAQLEHYFERKNTIVQPYLWTIFVIAFAMAYFELFFSWAKVQLKSVFGNFLKEVFHRLAVAMLLVAVYWNILTVPQFIGSIVGVYVVRMILMKWYAFRLHAPPLRFRLPSNYKEVLTYASLILIAGSVAAVLIDIDKFMIERYLPIGNVAMYGMCAYIASVIGVPSRAMHQITYPLTAKLLHEGKMNDLSELYQQSSLNLFLFSGLIFTLILCNVTALYTLIPSRYELLFEVVLCIALVKLFDNLLGNNNAILFSSKYYKIILVYGVVLTVIAISLNSALIPELGLKGAALATTISMLCYNMLKLHFVYKKFGMLPFSKNTLKIMGLIAACVLSFLFWELPVHPIFNIVLKSSLIVLIYSCVAYFYKLSPVTNTLVNTYFKKR